MSKKDARNINLNIPNTPQISMIAAQITTAFYTALLLKKMSGVEITAEVEEESIKEVAKKINCYAETIKKEFKNRPL